MSAENRLSLLGNIGSADSIRVIDGEDGPSVVSFSLAVTEYRYNPETKQNEKMTDWHKATAFGFMAKRIVRFVEQGQRILLHGRLAKEKYEYEGQDRWDYFCQIEDFAPLSSRSEGDAVPASAVAEANIDEDEFPF